MLHIDLLVFIVLVCYANTYESYDMTRCATIQYIVFL